MPKEVADAINLIYQYTGELSLKRSQSEELTKAFNIVIAALTPKLKEEKKEAKKEKV